MVRLLILIIAFFAAAYPAAAKKQEHATPRQVIQKEVECLTTNEHQLNGANYFLQVFVKEYGHWRIAESTVAPTNRLLEAGLGFGTAKEKEYAVRRKAIK